MKIKRLIIENFKSIERIELIEPNPFTVFVGPNGSGKSNIFEALEYINFSSKNKSNEVDELFGGSNTFLNRKLTKIERRFEFLCQFQNFECVFRKSYNEESILISEKKGLHKLMSSKDPVDFSVERVRGDNTFINSKNFYYSFDRDTDFGKAFEALEYLQFFEDFSRMFIGNDKYEKLRRNSSYRLSLSAANLEKVLGRLLSNKFVKEELNEWLSLFLQSFDRIEIIKSSLTGEETLLFYDKVYDRPFTRELISDGTYNILALLTAIYQSDDPQFLCIEEPENGLNPKVVKELVNLCRYACEEFGHFIWLNTHSQTLVSQLTPDEIVLVDKKEGTTQIKQIKGMDLHGLPMDEAWLSNALGGGLPW